MKFKREKIKRSQLDELSKTMSVIPMSELMLMMGEYAETHYFDDIFQLTNFISAGMFSIEIAFVRFTDGTFAAHIDWDKNTDNKAYIALTPYASGSQIQYYAFEGKIIDTHGHTHLGSGSPFPSWSSDPEDESDMQNKADYPEIPNWLIYYGGNYYSY